MYNSTPEKLQSLDGKQKKTEIGFKEHEKKLICDSKKRALPHDDLDSNFSNEFVSNDSQSQVQYGRDTQLLQGEKYMIKNDTIRTQFVTMEKVHYVTRIENADGTDHEVLFLAQRSGIPMFPFISQRLI